MKIVFSMIPLSFKQNAIIYDEFDKELYYTENPGWSWRRRACVYEKATGKLLFNINSIPFSIPRTLTIEDAAGNQIAEIKNTFQFFRLRISISSVIGDMELKGEFASREYTIEHEGKLLCEIHRSGFGFGLKYQAEILDEDNLTLYIGLLFALNIIFSESNHSLSNHQSF